MRLFGATRTALAAAGQIEASAGQALDLYESMWKPPPPAYTVGLTDIPGLLGGMFGLDTAMLVPAYVRGLKVITGVASGLPLLDLDPATGELMQPYGLTAADSMWPGRPNAALWTRTVTDLVNHGRAYWHIVDRNGFGHPVHAEPVDVTRVQHLDLGVLTVDGERVWPGGSDEIDGRNVIVFDTGLPGALDNGWLALRTAISLEQAANTYATDPMPTVVLASKGVDLTEEETQEVLAAWRLARQTGSTAYLNSQVGFESVGWNAADLQLAEGRQHAAIEVARLLNLDPVWVGASQPGSSLTYQNRQDLYTSLLDVTVLPLLRIIEQRLSLPDVSGGQRQLRFDTTAFMRANLNDRVAALTAYVAAGVITPEQAADLEPMIRRGALPQ